MAALDDFPERPQATNNEIRQCGGFLVIIGLPAAYFLREWYVAGMMPAEWIAYLDIFIGLWMLIFPRPWRYRVGRLKVLGSDRPSGPPAGE